MASEFAIDAVIYAPPRVGVSALKVRMVALDQGKRRLVFCWKPRTAGQGESLGLRMGWTWQRALNGLRRYPDNYCPLPQGGIIVYAVTACVHVGELPK